MIRLQELKPALFKVVQFFLVAACVCALMTSSIGCGSAGPSDQVSSVSSDTQAKGIDSALAKLGSSPEAVRGPVLQSLSRQIKEHGTQAQKDAFLKLGGKL
jgi:hypothetical protein